MTVPTSTYRLQLSHRCTFRDAAALVPYLASLGAGALHASPLLTAAPGSEHGYDVADPTRVSDVLGGEQGRRALVAALREHGMQLVVDIVPNHLGVADPRANPAWWDLLRRGPDSRYASWFDTTGWPLRLPVLADDPAALEDLRVDDSGDDPVLRYHSRSFPLAPGTVEAGSAQRVHEAQHYRLVSWRADLGYRRFFAVSDLAAVKVEDPAVFAALHGEVLRWVAAGDVDGLRVDHPDGLTDPTGYAHRLRQHAPDAWIVGCELWDHSLVDPDNGRPVDFTARRELLERLDAGWLPEVDATGAAKLLVVSRALRTRRDHPERFTDYAPVLASGDAAQHAVAFERRGVIAVATRLPVGLAARGGWGDTILPLPDGSWTDALTDTPVHGTPELSQLLPATPPPC